MIKDGEPLVANKYNKQKNIVAVPNEHQNQKYSNKKEGGLHQKETASKFSKAQHPSKRARKGQGLRQKNKEEERR